MTLEPSTAQLSDQSAPVEDSVARVNDELAVGANLAFQKRWWRFERAIWGLFGLTVLLNVIGLIGAGPLSRGHVQTADGALSVNYQRVLHFDTPAVIEISFARAVSAGHVALHVNKGLLIEAGLQGANPNPETTVIGTDGGVMVFAASATPTRVLLKLQPSRIGIDHVQLGTDGSAPVAIDLVVLP